MKTRFVLFVLLSGWVISCILPINPNSKINFKTAAFSTTPVNFSELNTFDNDYNSAGPPSLIAGMPFIFSSDRTSRQYNEVPNRGKFDFLAYSITFHFNQNNGTWDRRADPMPTGPRQFGTTVQPANFTYGLLQRANTSANELGPYIRLNKDRQSDLFMYASDSTGNLNIYYLSYPLSCIECGNTFTGTEPLPANLLNSDKDDAYPTLTADNNLLFTSNRNGDFDLFSVSVDGQPIQNVLATKPSTDKTPQPIVSLNSPADDKCPYINGSLLVFTSNRAGGYGGFDLYYAKWKDGQWSAPVNFGPAINSSADEYRPVVFQAPMFENNLIIFSSNRPGGKGGFDLYFVGISKDLTDS